MKIAYFTDFFFPVLGGVSTAINNLSAGLANRGSEVVIFAPKWRNFTHPVKNKRIQVRFLPSLNVGIPDIRITLLFYPNLYGFMRKFQADVIHVESPLTVGIAGIIIAKLMKKPLVGNFHGYPNWGLVGIKKSTLLNSLYLKYDAFILNFCDLVITPGKIGETELKKHGLKKPIFLIPNSINESEFQEQPAQTVLQLKKKYGLKKNVVLFVGRLVIEKSIHVLIKSFARILKEAPDTSLFIIGDGVYRDELIALCNKLGISDNVVFAGEIKQAQLLTQGYFQVGDVFATASVTEVQPITLLEAMYFGLPLVGVDKRGVGEMVDKAGLLCAADDEENLGKNMLKVLIDPVLKKKLHENSLYYYKKRYAWYTVVEQYETVYKKLITSYLKL